MDISLLPKNYQRELIHDLIDRNYRALINKEYRSDKERIKICKGIISLTNQLFRVNGHDHIDAGKEYAAALAVLFESEIKIADDFFPIIPDEKPISHAASLLKAFEKRYGKDGGFARNRGLIKGRVIERLNYGGHINEELHRRLKEIGIDGEVVDSANGMLQDLDKELEEEGRSMAYLSKRYMAIDSMPDKRANIGSKRRKLCEAVERENKDEISRILREGFGIEREPKDIKIKDTRSRCFDRDDYP
jgi:hypothetical protein